jgi:hypothetical protein
VAVSDERFGVSDMSLFDIGSTRAALLAWTDSNTSLADVVFLGVIIVADCVVMFAMCV